MCPGSENVVLSLKNPLLTRRRVLQGAGASIAALATAQSFSRNTTAETRSQPNIILILTDDMRVSDLPYLPYVQEMLVTQGATLTNFTAAAPGCGPARASILRGQYPHSHGVQRGSGDFGGLDRFRGLGNEESTIATWLHDAGYRTALVGKYLNGYGSTPDLTTIPPGWDDWYGVTNEGYSRFTINEQGVEVRYTSRKEETHATDVLADHARAIIADVAPTGQPFFLHISPRAPHVPTEPASWYADAFPDVTLPDHPGMNEADVSDKPDWVQIQPSRTAQEMDEIETHFRQRLQTLLSVDDLVADVVEELERQGVLDTTYILFSSDNGFGLGEHRVALKKGSPYEEVITVPMVVRGPRIAPGVSLDVLASQVDLGPTFAAWAGAATPEFAEGRSLGGILAGEPVPDDWRQFQFVEYFVARSDRRERQPAFQTLRTPAAVYVTYGSGEEELYDLVADPYQTENQAAVTDPDLLAELQEVAAAMLSCEGARCRQIDQEPLPAWPTP